MTISLLQVCRVISIGASLVGIDACNPVSSQMEERGFCAKQQRYIDDVGFLRLVLAKWGGAAWEDQYATVGDFVSANPQCCQVVRYPHDEDWRSASQELDVDGKIPWKLSQLDQGRYVVWVGIQYRRSRASSEDVANYGYWLSACGDLLLRVGW